MRRLRTLVVVHASLVPPESLEGHSDKEIEEWRTEYDVTTALRKLGHDVRCIGVLDSLTELRGAIADWEPDIVFNLLEEFDGIVTYDQHVVAFLELKPPAGHGLQSARAAAVARQVAFQAAAGVSPHRHAAVRRVPARRAHSCAAQAAFSAVREIHGRGRIPRDRAGIGGGGCREAEGTH